MYQLDKIQSEIDSISSKMKPLQARIIPGNKKHNFPIIYDLVILDNRRKELQTRRWNVMQYIKKNGGN